MTRRPLGYAYLPEDVRRLPELAMNLFWSWSHPAREVFRRIDPTTWSSTRHDPLALLRSVDPARLAACVRDARFMECYHEAVAELDRLSEFGETWFHRTFPDLGPATIAYFCAEFGLHNSVPIYSGGLGVLAGDHCKEASDLGLDFVCVGLLYSKGYFDQKLDQDGWQKDADESFDPSALPLVRIEPTPDNHVLCTVSAAGREIAIGAWEMRVGRSRVILLDTNLKENAEEDRELTSKLYGGGQELRLKQEWVLGVGGTRVLRTLGVDPHAWHANEGHAAFMFVERIRELLDTGSTLEKAISDVRANSVFTTHPPVPAGHDSFSPEQIEHCLGSAWDQVGLTREEFLALGDHPTIDHDTFHMTAAAIRLARGVNGVSKRHGAETRRIWAGLWPGREASEIPIGHVTNGVHRPTWMGQPITRVLDQTLGMGWERRMHEPGFWAGVADVDPALLWRTHLVMKESFFRFIRDKARRQWRERGLESPRLATAGTLLEPEVLTLGFARRFASYKRADLILRNEGRLLRLLTNSHRPVQIVFAGKAHPADDKGKQILQQVFRFAQDQRIEGRIAFLEDYEMHLAHRIYEGVDVWLNIPRVPMEASGTSGMKAALNGVPQLGTLDGWWAEGYNGMNGWAIPATGDDGDVDEADWDNLFTLLEDEVVPLFHERNGEGIPIGWVERMANALMTAGKAFTTERMVQEYATDLYVPAVRGRPDPDDPPSG
ncbi:MAG: alpha-glucan family phosphorylase [Longimicrobiales bacterium]